MSTNIKIVRTGTIVQKSNSELRREALLRFSRNVKTRMVTTMRRSSFEKSAAKND